MAEPNPTLQSLESKLVEVLLNTQDHSGGWAEHPGGGLSPFNTAEVVMALSVADRVKAGAALQQSINKALDFLIGERDHDPMVFPDAGAWYRKGGPHGNQHKAPDIIRTALIIGAFSRAGESFERPELATALNWLVERQNKDSGWGYQRNKESRALPTCFALQSLIAASPSADKSPWKTQIENGLQYLTNKVHNPDGSFGNGILQAAHTIYSCLVLQAARSCGFRTVASAETDAIKWLLNNQDAALAPVEEKIEIDSTGAADYQFMFTMEALLLRVLANSQDEKDRQKQLWWDVQRSMHGAFDENTGGFYGRRVFSWSTANGLYAIKLSENNLKEIPPRPAEAEDSGRFKVGNLILIFALILVVATVYLTVVGKFTALQASFFWGLVLACLVAYQAIGEKTFGQLASSLRWGAKKGE
jgi:Squalene-hopene cyclase C-terminal domain